MTVRVLIADDHPVVRDGLRAILSTQDDIEVVGEAGTGADAVRLADETVPDVVLMDLQMPDGDGVSATAAIKQQSPVRLDSSILSAAASTSRTSAGARSPGPSKVRWPPTSSEAGTSAGVPPRITVAFGAPSVDVQRPHAWREPR